MEPKYVIALAVCCILLFVYCYLHHTRTLIVLLQLSQGEAATPIFTPDEGYNWKIAKACFEATDFMSVTRCMPTNTPHLVYHR